MNIPQRNTFTILVVKIPVYTFFVFCLVLTLYIAAFGQKIHDHLASSEICQTHLSCVAKPEITHR